MASFTKDPDSSQTDQLLLLYTLQIRSKTHESNGPLQDDPLKKLQYYIEMCYIHFLAAPSNAEKLMTYTETE